MRLLFQQYDLIREAREPLFRYCSTIAPEHFIQNLEAFGGRSMRYLFVHVSNTYRFWLGHFTQMDKTEFVKASSITSVQEVRLLFEEINILTNEFLKHVHSSIDQPIINKIPKREQPLTLTPLQLYTHVVTHEYHHKGQLLSMSRQLGYIPVDTDIIRLE